MSQSNQSGNFYSPAATVDPYNPTATVDPYNTYATDGPEPTYYPPTTAGPPPVTFTGCKKIPAPAKGCPWKSEVALANGDCADQPGKCNLKYFKVCGGHWFSQIYCDVCQWKESLQLVPMITAKLVPLGVAYERKFSECDGFGPRTLQDLLVDEGDRAMFLRDVPQ